MATPVAPTNPNVSAIRTKIRRLTASSSESALSTTIIDEAINTFYNNDFPYAIKLDQMRSVFTFFTTPFQDKYPVDVNYNQSFRDPVYFEGVQGNFFKDRNSFYNLWPRWPSKFQPIQGDGVTQQFNFTIQGPFLSNEVVLGGVDVSGAGIHIHDDTFGNLYCNIPNPVVSVPVYNATYPSGPNEGMPIPGMYNINTQDPGLNTKFYVGTVNYITGQFIVDTGLANLTFAAGTTPTVWVSTYNPGRPYSCMYWNNFIEVRPVPDNTYKIEIECYQTPVQFMESTDIPILNQWWQYIAYGAAMEILRERQDLEGVENLREGFLRQEALVLERQGSEEIGVCNQTIMSGLMAGQGWNQFGYGGWF